MVKQWRPVLPAGGGGREGQECGGLGAGGPGTADGRLAARDEGMARRRATECGLPALQPQMHSEITELLPPCAAPSPACTSWRRGLPVLKPKMHAEGRCSRPALPPSLPAPLAGASTHIDSADQKASSRICCIHASRRLRDARSAALPEPLLLPLYTRSQCATSSPWVPDGVKWPKSAVARSRP